MLEKTVGAKNGLFSPSEEKTRYTYRVSAERIIPPFLLLSVLRFWHELLSRNSNLLDEENSRKKSLD